MGAHQTKVVPMPDTLCSVEDRAADDSAAIEALIHRETACFRDRDFDGWAACHLHSPRTCTVSASPELGVTALRGWDAIRDDMVDALALGRTPCGMAEFRKDNMQITVDGDLVVGGRPFLQEGMEVEVEMFEGEAIGITLPDTVTMTLTETEPVVKGQTAASSFKPGVLENGERII